MKNCTKNILGQTVRSGMTESKQEIERPAQRPGATFKPSHFYTFTLI